MVSDLVALLLQHGLDYGRLVFLITDMLSALMHNVAPSKGTPIILSLYLQRYINS
jgi:hypothetical protein